MLNPLKQLLRLAGLAGLLLALLLPAACNSLRPLLSNVSVSPSTISPGLIQP